MILIKRREVSIVYNKEDFIVLAYFSKEISLLKRERCDIEFADFWILKEFTIDCNVIIEHGSSFDITLIVRR